MSTVALRSNSASAYPVLPAGALSRAPGVHEAGPAGAPKPRLLDRVREAVRTRHYSRRTEKAYVHWVIFFHGKRHPAEMGAPEVTADRVLIPGREEETYNRRVEGSGA